MKKEVTIYDLELNEMHIIEHGVVVRVPGGWIYLIQDEGGGENSVFVPYNNEFESPIKLNVPKYKRKDIEDCLKYIDNAIIGIKQLIKDGGKILLDQNDEPVDVSHFETALKILKSNTK